jgi:hypothetical protein
MDAIPIEFEEGYGLFKLNKPIYNKNMTDRS